MLTASSKCMYSYLQEYASQSIQSYASREVSDCGEVGLRRLMLFKSGGIFLTLSQNVSADCQLLITKTLTNIHDL